MTPGRTRDIDPGTESGARAARHLENDLIVAALPADAVPAYVEKYANGLREPGMTPAELARNYSAAVRVRPTSLRSH